MQLPYKLSIYLARNFLMWLFIGFLVCAILIFMVDLVELTRKSANKNISFAIVANIALLRLPTLLQTIAPFAVLFGGILCLTRLTRSRELVVVRSSGVSAWQFLAPAITASFLIGVFVITIFNPAAARLNLMAEVMQDKYYDNKVSQIVISKSGLWLKQINDDNSETLITAASISTDSKDFKQVSIFEFGPNNNFLRRIDAKEGKLEGSHWTFKKVIINTPQSQPEKVPNYTIPTNLTLAQIQDSFSSPDTMSFWDLPEFITVLEQAGFSALRHKLYFHTLLSTPILLAAMIFIAAVFSLRFSRRGRSGLMIFGAVMAGFLLYFITKFTSTYGMAGNMPIVLAAWTPAVISIIIGAWLLLHQEDG